MAIHANTWIYADNAITRDIGMVISADNEPNGDNEWGGAYSTNMDFQPGINIITIDADLLDVPYLGYGPFMVGIGLEGDGDIELGRDEVFMGGGHSYQGASLISLELEGGVEYMITCYVDGTLTLTSATWGSIKASF